MDTQIQLLKEQKEQCDTKYYDEGIQLIPDEEYDVINHFLSDQKLVDDVAFMNARRGKCKLPIQMWSLNKVRKYVNKPINCTVMDKLDGVSCMLHQGKAYTRGNGRYGFDITNLLNVIYHIEGYAIRGELVISKETFQKQWSQIYCTNRTAVSAFVHKTDNITKIERDSIDFLAYELISLEQDNDPDIMTQIKILHEHKIPTVYNHTFEKASDQDFENFLNFRNKYSNYSIDGIVVCIHGMIRNTKLLTCNPKYAFAYKKNFKGEITEVINITWDVTKSGDYIPVICVNPIQISGTLIQKISGNNLTYIKSKGIGIGAIVEVIKAGQVIPFIMDVIKKSNIFNIPEDCNEQGKLIHSHNDIRINKKKLMFFAKTLGINGIGPITAMELSKLNITPYSIISEGPSNLILLQKSRIFYTISNALSVCTPESLILATGILGPGIGMQKVKKLNFMNNPDCIKILQYWKKNWNPILASSIITGYTKLACISGTRRHDVEHFIQYQGFEISYTLQKATDTLFVVFKDKDKIKKNVKISKAIENGVKILYLNSTNFTIIDPTK